MKPEYKLNLALNYGQELALLSGNRKKNRQKGWKQINITTETK